MSSTQLSQNISQVTVIYVLHYPVQHAYKGLALLGKVIGIKETLRSRVLLKEVAIELGLKELNSSLTILVFELG